MYFSLYENVICYGAPNSEVDVNKTDKITHSSSFRFILFCFTFIHLHRIYMFRTGCLLYLIICLIKSCMYAVVLSSEMESKLKRFSLFKKYKE